MKVGVVGAGMAGLGAGRTLSQAGAQVVLFERTSEVGGRCATQSIGDFLFDSGATSIAPRGHSLEHVMLAELDTSNLIAVEKPVYTHVALRAFPGDPAKNSIKRYTYLTGNQTLPRLIANELDVRTGIQIEEIGRDGRQYILEGETFDAVILTPPLPSAATLLWSLQVSRAISNSRYRACLSVMLGYSLPTPAVNYHALLDPEQRHPLTWLSVESVKSSGRAPEGSTALIAQLSPSYSQEHFDSPDSLIYDDVADYIARLYGDEWRTAAASGIKRWKYSQPESYSLFETVNRPGSKVLLASDGILGGRVEYAYEVGVRTAKLLLESS